MNDLTLELDALSSSSTSELCQRYQQLFGQPVRTRHKAYLLRKIAWRLQARAEGDLTERARRRVAELADDGDVRVMPPRAQLPATPELVAGGTRVVKVPPAAPPPLDPRLPPAGTSIVRRYKGRTVEVHVLPGGFEHDGRRFNTLTAVAAHVTGGSHVNGYRFFKLEARS